MTQTWDGDEYQARFDRLAETGKDMHGEARFVRVYRPTTVLDAGCGSGRVAIELARTHGDTEPCHVTGVDRDESMLATARRLGPDVDWVLADLATLALGRTFDVVVMAGNVPLFAAPGTDHELVVHVAGHVADGGVLIAGFSTDWADRPYDVDRYDRACADSGLELVERFSTWDRDPWTDASGYAVSVHANRRSLRDLSVR